MIVIEKFTKQYAEQTGEKDSALIAQGGKIRRAAVDHNIPLITNARLASAYIWSVCKIGVNGLGIRHWGEY